MYKAEILMRRYASEREEILLFLQSSEAFKNVHVRPDIPKMLPSVLYDCNPVAVNIQTAHDLGLAEFGNRNDGKGISLHPLDVAMISFPRSFRHVLSAANRLFPVKTERDHIMQIEYSLRMSCPVAEAKL